MSFIKKYYKKIRNMFHIPGEDVIIIGLDDRNKSLRIYDLYVKTGSKFQSNLENKVLEGNVAQIFLWFNRFKLEHDFFGWYDKDNSNLLHVEFVIDKREGDIFKTDDKPEGIAYLMDMQTGQGAHLVRRSTVESLLEGIAPVAIEKTDIADEGYMSVTIPQQIRLQRDPIMDMLVSVNPYFWGSTIDSFIATELLRGKVEIWKIILVGLFCMILGFVAGMGF